VPAQTVDATLAWSRLQQSVASTVRAGSVNQAFEFKGELELDDEETVASSYLTPWVWTKWVDVANAMKILSSVGMPPR
jgi:hypothetical protein